MSTLFTLLSSIAFIMFIVGLFSPSNSLFFIKEKEKRTKKQSAIIYLAAWLILGIIGAATGGPSSGSSKSDSEATDSTNVAKEQVAEEKSPWEYTEEVDKMTDNKTFYAITESTNEVDFKFPYNGGSTMQLGVRNMNGENVVYFQISKGQFMTSIMQNENIRVRFDEEKPVTYTYSMPADVSLNLIFVSNSKNLISKLKTAKTITVDFPFFQEGRVIFNFNVANLKWEH